MPLPTPFHERTQALNQSQEWRDWSGYLGAGVYETHHEREYWAVRNSAALFDVSPLFKYEIQGPDAVPALNRIMTRDISGCAVGQVVYSPWCDDDGKLIDDGTITRLSDQAFRVTAADPSLRWFQDVAFGMDAQIEDVSEKLAALSLQGPNSRAILGSLFKRLGELPYYRWHKTRLNRRQLEITRTGYTGDLGYELWIPAGQALKAWDRLEKAGGPYGLQPAGLAALDIVRIEAGLILNDVDYISSPRALIPDQKSSPFEAGLGWTVQFTEGNNFIGRRALEIEKARPTAWVLAGLEIDWRSLEAIYGAVSLPPQVTGRANRSSVPVYVGHRQAGYATSHTFSPILKKYIALATLEAAQAAPGTQLEVEFTVEHQRRRAAARVVRLPFLDLARKKATPKG